MSNDENPEYKKLFGPEIYEMLEAMENDRDFVDNIDEHSLVSGFTNTTKTHSEVGAEDMDIDNQFNEEEDFDINLQEEDVGPKVDSIMDNVSDVSLPQLPIKVHESVAGTSADNPIVIDYESEDEYNLPFITRIPATRTRSVIIINDDVVQEIEVPMEE